MPAGDESQAKLSVVVFSGTFDKVHYALAMAAAALASNRQATLFFTMEAVRALLKATPDGRPGWQGLRPGANGLAAASAERDLTEKGIGGFEELLAANVALGATVMVCEMGLRALGVSASDLRDDVPVTAGGLVSFLDDASARGAVVFI